MTGMICAFTDCGKSSNDARPPRCTISGCPGQETFAPSDFQLRNHAKARIANIKKAFTEHDIPWPRIAKHTPGPHRVEVGQKGSGPWDRTTIQAGPEHSSTVLATVNVSIDNGLGNAKLFAAAADLLAAILNSDDAHWTPAMRAAVVKATDAAHTD